MSAHTALLRCAAVALAVVAVAAHQRALADGMWDMIGRSLKEGEQLRAICAENPSDDRCKETPASTLLIWCESTLPENLGRCHGALGAFAHDGAALLPEWQCVPQAVTGDEEQLRRLFLREAGRLPEILHQPARKLLYYSVLKAFPCPLRAH